MDTKKTTRRTAEPRVMYAVRVPVEASKRVRVIAERWDITPTAAAGKLLQIGLEAEAKAYDPNKELDAIGYALEGVAYRLERIDKITEAAARAAIKSAMVLVRQLRASSDAPDVMRRLDAAVEKLIGEVRK